MSTLILALNVYPFYAVMLSLLWIQLPLECKNACCCVFPPDQDGAEPSANSVSAFNLLRLSDYTGRQEWLQKSKRLLAAFTDRLTRVPIALPEMVRALMAQHYTLKQVFVLLSVQLAISFSLLDLCKRVTCTKLFFFNYILQQFLQITYC